jgi:hypothetical protein
MTVDELIGSGWERHATVPHEVAAELEKNVALVEEPAKASAFLGLANHTIGEHLADWHRAEALASQVVATQPHTAAMTGAWTALAVAHFMVGNWPAALAMQALILRLGQESAVVVQIKLGAQVAKAVLGAKRYAEGMALYQATVDLARANGETASDRTVAIVSNNLASELLELVERTSQEQDLMLNAAQISAEFWGRCGTWVNTERGLFLLALVHNAAAQPDIARSYGERALETIACNGEEKVDEAFIRLALADSFRLAGDWSAYERQLQDADGLASAFPDSEGLKSWFSDARRKVLWQPRDVAAASALQE